MNERISIRTFYKNPSTPYMEIVQLLHESFKERLDQNLKFGCATITIEEYKKYTKNSHIFVAYNNENNELVGTAILTEKVKFDIKYVNFEFLAVHSKYKRFGVGSFLFKECQKNAINKNYECITSSTAIGAKSSVEWHKKMGYKIFKYDAFPDTNYYSYCFIKPLCNSFKVKCILLLKPLILLLTYIKSKLKYKR